MNSREENIESWIFHEGVKNDRRSRIIPSSTNHITHTPVGTALDAMEKIAFYFGDRPELPTVELGQIKEHEITLTFGHDVILEEPFRQVTEDHQDQWAIAHEDALALSTGRVYGQQTAALTAIGNSLTGGKVLLNTNRWQVLGSVGLAQFTTALMVGQVMEQATEPWARDHHLWLVGYRELGPKLVNFLTPYHDEFRFHLVETLDQITADDLAGTSATIYVMGSSASSLETYERLRSDTVGMLTDTVVTELAMFISEDEDGGATVVNAGPHGLKIWPNLVGEGSDLYEAMEITWHKRQQEATAAEEAASALTIDAFLETEAQPAEQDPRGSTSISVEELEAMMEQESFVPDQQPAEPVEVAEEQAPALDEQVAAAPVEATEEQPPAPEQEPPVVEAVEEPEEPATAAVDVAVEEPPVPAGEEPVPVLSLLGKPQIHGADGSAEAGKPAEAVAYLHCNGLTAEAGELTKALWPEAEAEGHAARTRRTRTAKKIQDTLPGTFHNDAEWTITPVTTDLDGIITALSHSGDPQQVINACQAIQVPLQGCAEWVDEHRTRITDQLRQALDETTDRALESDQFEIAKAARQASKKL